ncbi:HD domain-containing protein [Obba rivulosa]|uniref:5'-deoxynucleotidase n=1 Tax=Obba rivulosa TaxID=1052685 RepID=A0A8E2J799_9APHY|nr:HD domain-containing protein [Obba rivulosa]
MNAMNNTPACAPETAPKRTFPPLYVPTGDASADRLAFFHILERLKTQKRTGWVDNKVPGPESISDHMYRMAVLAMCTSDTRLDISKCVMMALIHDLAEAQVGDIAPREGIPKSEKRRLEAEAMHNFVHGMLHNSPAAQRIEALWKEYEDGETEEARFVKDLDRFEMASQALEYERNHGMKTLQPFFDSSLPFIRHPEVQEWGRDLAAERERMQSVASSSSDDAVAK